MTASSRPRSTALSRRWLPSSGMVPVALICLGCNHLSGDASDRLRQLGKAVCDARTFEATGRWTLKGDSPEGPVPIRALFGPRGEYRIGAGNTDVIHDTHYVACVRPDEGYVGVGETQAHQPPQGPHNRWPGDMIMAAGMGTQGKADMILPYMRCLGAAWLDERFPDAQIHGAGYEVVNGHMCARCDIRYSGALFRIWVDTAEPIMWRNASTSTRRGQSWHLIVDYESVRTNHDVPPQEFSIPDWMFEENDNRPKIERRTPP